jgi:heme-binding protein
VSRRIAALAGVLASFAIAAGCSAARTSGLRAVAPAPPSAASVDDPEVRTLLVDACFPCHSGERADPWYAKLAPSSWTSGARRVLDFSEWASYDAPKRDAERAMIAAAVENGSMPPRDYTFFNGAAKLSEAERQAIIAWAQPSPPLAAH